MSRLDDVLDSCIVSDPNYTLYVNARKPVVELSKIKAP